MGPRLKVSSDRLVKPGIEPAIPGLQGKRFIHYTTVALLNLKDLKNLTDFDKKLSWVLGKTLEVLLTPIVSSSEVLMCNQKFSGHRFSF